MSALEFVATLRRRWYVLALVGLCTMAGILAVHKRSIAYQGCENFYLSGPSSQRNTYLNPNPSLAMVTGMVTQRMMSQPMQQEIRSKAVVADYAVMQTNTSGDIRFPTYTQATLQACVSSSSSQGVLAATKLVTTGLSTVLREMQVREHVPQNAFIKIVLLTPAAPAAIFGRPSLAYVGVLLFGAVSGIALAVWSDRLLPHLSRRWSSADRPRPANGNVYRRMQGSKG